MSNTTTRAITAALMLLAGLTVTASAQATAPRVNELTTGERVHLWQSVNGLNVVRAPDMRAEVVSVSDSLLEVRDIRGARWVIPHSEIRRLDVQRGVERNAKTALRYTAIGIGAGLAAVFAWDAIRSRSHDGFGSPNPPYHVGLLGGAAAGFVFNLSRDHRRWVTVRLR